MDLEAEALVFERLEAGQVETDAVSGKRRFDLDKVRPAIPGGSWPPDFTISREQIYDEAGRLTGGPQNEDGHVP